MTGTGSHFYPRQYRQISFQKISANMMTIDGTSNPKIQTHTKLSKDIKNQTHINLKKASLEKTRLKSENVKTLSEVPY